MASVSNFRTSKRRHSMIDARTVFKNKSIGEMISQGRNAFPSKVMQMGFVKLKVMLKQHVNIMI